MTARAAGRGQALGALATLHTLSVRVFA